MDFDAIFSDVVDKLEGWLAGTIKMLPNLVGAILIVLLFGFLSNLARKLVIKLFNRVSHNPQVSSLLGSIAKVIVLCIGLFLALEALQLSKAVTTLLAGAGVVGLAIGFAFQDIASNFISGTLLAIRRPFSVGHLIETNGFFGVVEEMNLRSTLVRRLQGQVVHIPNSKVFGEPIINYNERESRRVDLNVGVSYDDDLEKAKKIAIQAVESIEGRDTTRPVEHYYEGFGGSSIDFVIRFWIPFDKQPDFLKARDEAIIRIKKAFDEHDIGIPFPIRTLDFGAMEKPFAAWLQQGNQGGAPHGSPHTQPQGDA